MPRPPVRCNHCNNGMTAERSAIGPDGRCPVCARPMTPSTRIEDIRARLLESQKRQNAERAKRAKWARAAMKQR